MTDTTIISNIKHVFKDGEDFDSSNVRMVCGGVDDESNPFIGVSWDWESVYWFAVDLDEVENMASTVANGESVGSYASRLSQASADSYHEFDGAYDFVVNHVNTVSTSSLMEPFIAFHTSVGLAV